MKFLSRYDADTKTATYIHVDDVDPRRLAFETVQDKKSNYEANRLIRNLNSKLEIPDFGCAVADIPFDDYAELKKEYPDLAARGPGAREERQKALQKILTSHPKRHLWLLRANFYSSKKSK